MKNADILVVATGIPGLIHGDMLKPGCAIIDVGINRVKNPKTGKNMLVGDCDFESKLQRPDRCCFFLSGRLFFVMHSGHRKPYPNRILSSLTAFGSILRESEVIIH